MVFWYWQGLVDRIGCFRFALEAKKVGSGTFITSQTFSWWWKSTRLDAQRFALVEGSYDGITDGGCKMKDRCDRDEDTDTCFMEQTYSWLIIQPDYMRKNDVMAVICIHLWYLLLQDVIKPFSFQDIISNFLILLRPPSVPVLKPNIVSTRNNQANLHHQQLSLLAALHLYEHRSPALPQKH